MEKTIYITTPDMARLVRLIAGRIRSVPRDAEYLEVLQDRLDRAELVESCDIPPNVVTMNSEVLVRDLDTGAEAAYRLVFPNEADMSRGWISILAPIGTAMLGYCVGDTIEWRVPKGVRRLRVTAIPYQPEAAAAAAHDSMAGVG